MKQPNIKVCQHDDIIEYYNYSVGANQKELQEILAQQKTELDMFKNPKGSEFDLGKRGAFKNFRILVGQFYIRPNDFQYRDWYSTISRAHYLGQKHCKPYKEKDLR